MEKVIASVRGISMTHVAEALAWGTTSYHIDLLGPKLQWCKNLTSIDGREIKSQVY